MVIVVNERGFNYLRHNIQGKEKRKYLGKTIPKNIEQLKKEFLLEFYREEWNHQVQNIIDNYRKEMKSLPQSIQLKNFESFGIAFTYNTQRIEGSSLSQYDTRDLLVHGVTPTKKSKIDTIETQKHYDLFIKLVTSKKLSKITKNEVLGWHKEIFGQTKIGEAGGIRSHMVGVISNDQVEFALVPEIPKKLKEFFDWLNKYDSKRNIVEFAAMVHYKFVSIHPFVDGNGRISRLIMNYILFKYDCPLMLIKNNDRRAYFKSLEKSQLKNDEIHFLKWFMKYYVKANKQYM
ncbi:MAG: Fic family protein [Nitrosopumilus sp.]|nr:Fic family protein [Nitrosopumilus sp.]